MNISESHSQHGSIAQESRPISLRKVILVETGQDVLRCRGCGLCSAEAPGGAMDIPIEGLIQLAQQNDEEVLTSSTLWSDAILEAIPALCQRGLDLGAIIKALRQEAIRRKLVK